MILIRLEETRPADIGRDPWRVIMRRAHQAMGEHWHKNMLPDHFTEQARYRYRHKFRSRKYQREKEAKAAAGRPFRKGEAQIIKGGKVDNVLTGYMMQQIQSSKSIRAYPSRVTITMHGPRYITMRAYKMNQPNKAKELTTVTEAQKKELSGVLKQSVLDQLAAYRAARTTTI